MVSDRAISSADISFTVSAIA